MTKCLQNNVTMKSIDRRISSAFSFRRLLSGTLLGCGGQKQLYEEEDDEDERSEKNKQSSSSKLSEILKISEEEERRKVEMLEELQGVVKRLGSGDRASAASDVRRLTKVDPQARETLAMLGAIPPLVGMLHSYSEEEEEDSQISALYALLNLSIGNPMNKAAVVEAGAVHKMLDLLIHSPSLSLRESLVANFLGLSALDSNKPIIGSSGAIPFLAEMLSQHTGTVACSQLKQDCLGAIYNLSIFPPNVSVIILETHLLQYLLDTLGDMEVSDRILSILTNLVSTPQGRKAISNSPHAFPILIDALNWTDSPGCQEKASYILMLMAHRGYGDRQAMVEAGVVSSLLELTLIGTTLAQRRASRILDCLSADKGKQLVSENYHPQGGAGVVSAPICGDSTSIRPNQQDDEEMTMSDERKAVKQLVQLSLQNNMRRIVKRANLPQDFVPSQHFKSLATSSTSKSLPF